MRKLRAVAAFLVAGAIAGFPAQISLAAQSTPVPISGSVVWPANFVASGECSFDIEISFKGKAGQLSLPGGRTLLTSPGLKSTVTNLSNPTKSVTLNVTGAMHQTLQNGNIVTIATGRNLLGDPLAGIVLAIGTYSYIFDASGKLVQPLLGTGQLVSICKLIS